MDKPAFYRHHAADPSFNMAFDEWLLQQAIATPGSCFLRLYTWSEGTITFGHNQVREQALDFSRLDGASVIRRITGGRALYHDPAELTYALAWSTIDQPAVALSGRPSHAYCAIAEGLVDFLGRLGIASAYEARSSSLNALPGYFHKAPCFASHARYEIVAAGRKIVASAARAYRHAVLQHGSIKIHGLAAHPALPVDMDEHLSLPAGITAVEFIAAAESFAAAMGHKLGLDFAYCTLLPTADAALIERLDYVKRNRLLRRLIFERKALKSSL